MISMVQCATDTETRDISVEKVLEAVRTGGKKLKGQISQIRNRFELELAIIGDRKKARLAVDPLKKQLPGITWSGTFERRANDGLMKYSGLLCADVDSLGADAPSVRERLTKSPYLYALFDSPSGDGLKAVFRVPAEASNHLTNFRAVERHVRELTDVQIDESCKDSARLCFMSYDPELYVNENAVEIPPLPEPEKPKPAFTANGQINLSERQRIAAELLGPIEWLSDTHGIATCPAIEKHTQSNGRRDCYVYLDGTQNPAIHAPSIHCVHNSCRNVIEAFNHALRSRIGKAEYVKPETPRTRVQSGSQPVGEPLPPPAPYAPPPLKLLPPQLQEYVIAAAESLIVDVGFILLPLLSSLGAAIGNARSILLKRGFVQPPVIWTGIIGRSGSRKSPALEAACIAVMDYERELIQQNKQEMERYVDDLAAWEVKKRSDRGAKPEPPAMLTCLMDDLTLAALADAMQMNPRGLLVRKDELSHWFSSFDQFTKAKGADVSRWLSLHTGVFFGLDRRGETRAEKRCYRLFQPRVGITGGIQPKVLARALTEDFFERGLAARFLFAYPPARQDKWSEATVPENFESVVFDLFKGLWLLQPEKDQNDHPRPKFLLLSADAKPVFVEFYNECGAASVESGEHEEAAWCKLTGYAARLALVGQLARDPNAESVTGETMQAACNLARWCGNETVRIYATLAETQEQREQRKLVEFIESRGGAVSVRDLMQSYAPLKNQKEKAEATLNALINNGLGQREEVKHAGAGRPTTEFRLVRPSTSTQFNVSRGETGNSVDVDGNSSQEITLSTEPIAKAVPHELEAIPEEVLEL